MLTESPVTRRPFNSQSPSVQPPPDLPPIDPDWNKRQIISSSCGADIDLCWTCGTCDNECPVNLATERLRPQRIVRMAAYGMTEELLSLPDIWYCLSCRRCFQGCPNRVKPYELNRYLQDEVIGRGCLSGEFVSAYRKLLAEFQRVRWRTAAHCFKKRFLDLPDHTWYQWLKTPLRQEVYNPIDLKNRGDDLQAQKPVTDLKGQLCFTCGECSGCCPAFCDGDVFDPRKIIRMVTLGLFDELLRSPTIWLCYGCRKCAESCTQTVSGYDIIMGLQHQAIERGVVDPDLPLRLVEADRIIYPKFLDEIDTLVGLYRINPLDSGRQTEKQPPRQFSVNAR